jgi:glycosyltransferase involved in cell wall biosynthesis
MDEFNLIGEKNISIVVPVYNEQDAIKQFHQELTDVIDGLNVNFKIYYINDGSEDDTHKLLMDLAQKDQRVITVELSRNFGHQAALTAGLDVADGDAVITMDGDGQHPPEKIPEMLQLFEAGYEVVLMQRMEDRQPSIFKRWTSKSFYRILNWISDTKIVPDAADFRLLSRKVVKSLKDMREYHRFLRGMIAWTGFKTAIIPYSPPGRIAGQSKYSRKKNARFGSGCGIFLFFGPSKNRYLIGLFLLAAGIPRDGVCAQLLGQRTTGYTRTRLELSDVHYPHRRRGTHDHYGIHRYLYRLYLPGGQKAPHLFDSKHPSNTEGCAS